MRCDFTSTTAATRILGPPFLMMYAAWTRETIVVTIQVEKMSINRRRSVLSIKPESKQSGEMSRIPSAMMSANDVYGTQDF